MTCGAGVRAKTRTCITVSTAVTCHGDGMVTESCQIPCSVQISGEIPIVAKHFMCI